MPQYVRGFLAASFNNLWVTKEATTMVLRSDAEFLSHIRVETNSLLSIAILQFNMYMERI
jgi:hypothetical protein